jgi:amino-acid N-acetyltransferase
MTPHETQAFLTANLNARRLSQQEKTTQNLRLALNALKNGVERVHIIDGREEGSLLRELFSNRGDGVMIYSDGHEAIRALRSNEIPDVLKIMEPLVESGNLLERTQEDIFKKKDDYVVFDIDGSVHACGALLEWGEGQAEIAALASDAAQAGMGDRIVRYFIEKAKDRKLRRVFALTTKTQDWFELHGFTETTVDSLPAAKRRLYNTERKSKIFALDL